MPVRVLIFSLCWLLFACAPLPEPQQPKLPRSLTANHESQEKRDTFGETAFRRMLREEANFWLVHNRILFLGEGSSDWSGKWNEQHIRFAEILKEEYPHLDVWAADLETPAIPNKDVHVIAVDHRKPFPELLKRESFDAVIAMRILCHCKRDEKPTDNMMCGGIHSHETEYMEQLLTQIIAVLDRANPKSFAFLEGEERDPSEHKWMDGVLVRAQQESKKNWAEAISHVNEAQRTFRVSIVPTDEDHSRRKGILIAPIMSD